MDKKFIDEAVDAHNVYRSCHQVPPLTLSQELSQMAQAWAKELADTNSFKYSSCEFRGRNVGQNIAMKCSSGSDSYTGQEVTDRWYSEVKSHQFDNPEPRTNTGHFTQVIWKGSKEMGIGKAQTGSGSIIVVANYRSAGNITHQFRENVFPTT